MVGSDESTELWRPPFESERARACFIELTLVRDTFAAIDAFNWKDRIIRRKISSKTSRFIKMRERLVARLEGRSNRQRHPQFKSRQRKF